MNIGEYNDRISNEFAEDVAYLQGERNQHVNKLVDAIFNVKSPLIQKISRQQAKKMYLYKRRDGQLKLA